MLELSGVSFARPSRAAVFADVDLRAEPGSLVAVTGPSGSGKSTLLALIAGLLVPSAGSVRWDGRTAWVPELAWVPQTLASLPARSSLDNVLLGSLYDARSTRDRRSRAQSTLEQLGLGPLATRRARHLSGGELQRMSVARALVGDARVIVADEPTSQNDRDNARRIFAVLVDHAHECPDRLVIVATHDLEALPVAARAVQLSTDGLRPLARASV